MIVCLEGPSAAGKTTLAGALQVKHGALIAPELDATDAPPAADAEPWFSDRHAQKWRQARDDASRAPFAVLDGDPLKGLWYNWMHAADGWPGIDIVEPLLRSRLATREIGIPDLYIYLDATETQLRERRAGDRTRQRRGFEKNVRAIGPQRRYFAALANADPGRVAFIETSSRGAVVEQVMNAVEAARDRSRDGRDALALLATMARWVRSHPPYAPGD